MSELTNKLNELKEAAYRTWSNDCFKPIRRHFKSDETDGEKQTTCLCLVSAAAYDKMSPEDRQAFLNMDSGFGDLAMSVTEREFGLDGPTITNVIVGFDSCWDAPDLPEGMLFAKEIADSLEKEGKL